MEQKGYKAMKEMLPKFWKAAVYVAKAKGGTD
jgi:hypothetical protein